jgi:outer membrane receptor for ferrienterochelin and colicin
VSPATSTSSRSQAFGGSTNDNSYQLDGTDFTAPFTGAAWPWPNTDAIEEVQVLQLGASAEYGNVQGAVFNVVTRQGSNAFHGDGNFYYMNSGLTGRNTTDAQDDGLPYHRDEFKDTTWQIGGPLRKDKLWFFGSFQYQKDADSQPGTDPAFPARSSAKRIFWKVNYQVNQNNKIQAQEHDDFYDIPGRATALTAPSTIAVEHGHNPSPREKHQQRQQREEQRQRVGHRTRPGHHLDAQRMHREQQRGGDGGCRRGGETPRQDEHERRA